MNRFFFAAAAALVCLGTDIRADVVTPVTAPVEGERRSVKSTVSPPLSIGEICSIVDARDVIVRQEKDLETIENPDNVWARTERITINARAKCSTPPDADQTYSLGFIQQINSQKLIYTYDDASISLEYPSYPIMDTACAARDNSCRDNMPWYGVYPATLKLNPELEFADVDVAMEDNPSMQATWRETLPPYSKNFADHENLQRLDRKTDFTTWIVVLRWSDASIYPIARIDWSTDVGLPVDSSKPVGYRIDAKHVVVRTGDAVVRIRRSATDSSDVWSVPVDATLGPQGNSALETFWSPVGSTTRGRVRIQ